VDIYFNKVRGWEVLADSKSKVLIYQCYNNNKSKFIKGNIYYAVYNADDRVDK
jgi:hypothetical protein